MKKLTKGKNIIHQERIELDVIDGSCKDFLPKIKLMRARTTEKLKEKQGKKSFTRTDVVVLRPDWNTQNCKKKKFALA